MSFGFRLEHTHRQACVCVREISISMKLAHMEIIPDAICPACRYSLSEDEIRAGWRQDPHDFTTACPKCGERFAAALRIFFERKEEDGVRFLCIPQLKAAAEEVRRGKNRRLGVKFLFEEHPEVLFNMIRHFGSYERARKALKK